MEIDDIKVFLAIVRTGGITRAANSLFISQSSISYRIKKLEKELEIELIIRDRGKKGIELTQAGRMFLELAERFLIVNNEILNIKNGIPNFEIQIGCVDSVNLFILMPFYKELAKKFPSARIRIRTLESNSILKLVENKDLDAGFVLKKINSSKLKCRPVFREKMKIVCMKDSFGSNKTVTPDELDANKELYIDWGPEFRQWHNTLWESEPYLWIDSVVLMASFIQQKKVWGICPESVIPFFKNNNNCDVLNLTVTPPDRITYFITHTNLSNRTKKNLKLFEEIFKVFNIRNQYSIW